MMQIDFFLIKLLSAILQLCHPMRFCVTLLLLIGAVSLQAQPLRDINYRYLYDSDLPFVMDAQQVRSENGWTVHYSLYVRDTTVVSAQQYSIEWQVRSDLATKDFQSITSENVQQNTAGKIAGEIRIAGTTTGFVVAKVTDPKSAQAWMFPYNLERNYPVEGVISALNGSGVYKFAPTGTQVKISPDTTWILSYYNDVFPAAAPGFSETQARVSRGLKPDSVISVRSENITLFKNGLFLFQRDTTTAEGIALRAHDDYPRFANVRNLPGPLMYICTKQEYDRLESANGDKKIFDRTVLSITGDSERARRLIRNYFKRVELANKYFTSYKEGWKTDRGMVYIIFGLPEEIYKVADREIWKYNNETFKVTFNFIRSSSVFDPDNYVLIRDKKYQETWYEVIDLWRNARF